MLARAPVYGARGRPARRICASCLAAQRALLSTTAARLLPQAQQAADSETAAAHGTPDTKDSETAAAHGTPDTKDSETAATAQRKPRRRQRREVRPQPGPPDPPWPKAQTNLPRSYMTPRTIAENAVMLHQMRGVFSAAAASAQGTGTAPPAMTVAVPRMPDPQTDYTEIGPGVVAPWQPGGASFRPSTASAQTTGALGGPRRLGVKLRISDVHVIHPFSLKFLGNSDDIAPAGSGTSMAGFQLYSAHADGSAQPVFPHCLSEVVRRWYANKNRTDPLWWFVTIMTNENAGGADLATIKNVVRSKTHAKVQHAFKTALARRGYSPAGVRLSSDGDGDGDGAVVSQYAHLFGTVRIDAVLQRALEAKYEDLVEYMTGLLEGVEADLGDKGRMVDGVATYAGPPLHKRRPPPWRSSKRYKA